MCHMNRSGTEQHGFTPVGESRNIGCERRNHFGNAVNRPQFHVGNFERKLRYSKIFDRLLNISAEPIRCAYKAIEQLRACEIGNYVRRASTFNQADVESSWADFGI